VWNNGYPQAGMGYWLKSFNTKPAPVPGRHYSVPQINNCISNAQLSFFLVLNS